MFWPTYSLYWERVRTTSRSLNPRFITTLSWLSFTATSIVRDRPAEAIPWREAAFSQNLALIWRSVIRLHFSHECNIISSILYHSYYSRTLYVSWQRRVCKYGMCVFPQLSSELRKQSAVWVLCAGDSRIGCEEWSLPLSRIPAHLSPSAQSRPSQHFTPPQRHNLHRDAFVLETISLSLKLSLCDWQNISEGHDTPSLHRCTVETGATAFQSITAWTLHHCQHDLWGNWKREWNGFWMAGEERRKSAIAILITIWIIY